MKTIIVTLTFVLSLILTACSGGTPAISDLPTATVGNIALPTITDTPGESSEVSPTPTSSTPAEPAEASPTPTSSTSDPTTAGLLTFKIVPGESQVSYEVNEVFIDQGNVLNTAVGVTPQISGEITIDPTNPQNNKIGTITVDISQFKSDSSRRDRAIRDRFLESGRFPEATFVPQKIEGLPSVGQADVDTSLTISGDLTVHQVTKPVTFNAVVRANEKELTGEATTTILMSDFGVGPISLAGILKTDDEVKITLKLVARP